MYTYIHVYTYYVASVSLQPDPPRLRFILGPLQTMLTQELQQATPAACWDGTT